MDEITTQGWLMPVPDFLTRHATIEKSTLLDDGGGGQDNTWPPVGTFKFRMTTLSASQRQQYRREGSENIVRIQALDRLPVRIDGFTSLRELFLAGDKDRYRIVFNNRTFSPTGIRFPNEGQLGPGLIHIDCIETPQKVGYLDQDSV